MKKKVDIQVLNQAIGLNKAGKSQREIAKVLKISKSCVQNIIKRYEERQTLELKRGAGRKRKTTKREDRIIEKIASVNKKKSIRFIQGEVKRSNIDISVRTLCKRMNELGLESRKMVKKKLLLTKKHRAKRLEWCKKTFLTGNVLFSQTKAIFDRSSAKINSIYGIVIPLIKRKSL